MTATPKRPGPKPRPPWLSVTSRDAGLPAERAAWLAAILPALDATASYRAAGERLSVAGATAARWCAWLRAEQAAGRLPERAAPLPEHDRADVIAARPADPEQRRAAARSRWAKAAAAKPAAKRKPAKKRAKPRKT